MNYVSTGVWKGKGKISLKFAAKNADFILNAINQWQKTTKLNVENKTMKFPTKESDVAALSNSLVSGYTNYAVDFPNADVAAMGAARAAYLLAKDAQTQAQGQAQLATEAKDAALADLAEQMRTQLKQSEIDVVTDPEKLELIGWGPKSPPQPVNPPGQPLSFTSVLQGEGTVLFKWKSPLNGANGPVRSYLIERRDEPAGGGEFGPWTQAGISMEPELTLNNQPRGVQMEFRVIAVNIAGNGEPSNTVAVVL